MKAQLERYYEQAAESAAEHETQMTEHAREVAALSKQLEQSQVGSISHVLRG